MVFRRIKIRPHERGLLFRDRTFERILNPGRHWLVDPLRRVRVELASVREVDLVHPDLEVIARSGALAGQAEILDLKDHQRALVWVDGRFARIYGPGLHALWSVFHQLRVEIVDAGEVRFEHPQLATILDRCDRQLLEVAEVDAGSVALLLRDGRHVATLEPGTHALWRGVGRLRVVRVDLREQMLDVAGQEIMTADKVTLRLNAVVVYRVADAAKAVTRVEDYHQALYREAQLVLRAVVGSRELDVLLAEKDAVTAELEELLRRRAAPLGLEVVTLGVRDVILPGEMKALMNRVTEARKAAEANLITRREETAAMRSQANTARLLESNPTLMKLRELEVLEKVADKASLSVVLGDSGLADRLVKLI
ncbi:MAG: slipin family protein [Acidobacteria bacterium]|nr:MAG: slipin family protein [Acidobacteriota bacterium]